MRLQIVAEHYNGTSLRRFIQIVFPRVSPPVKVFTSLIFNSNNQSGNEHPTFINPGTHTPHFKPGGRADPYLRQRVFILSHSYFFTSHHHIYTQSKMTKLICIVGITGNQGGSVARRFLQDPNYRIRGLTRNTTSPTALTLLSLGIELVEADLNDVSTLIPAFKDANLIFSVTNYWEPFFHPHHRSLAASANISCRKHAYDIEYQQGKNIADAASNTVSTLDPNGFIVSTLSHAGKSSKGVFKELYHFDAKADVFPFYVRRKYPELERKMSCAQTGYFMSSYNLALGSYFKKLEREEGFEMRFPMSREKEVPHLAVNEDTGAFIYAVSKVEAGKDFMAEGSKLHLLPFQFQFFHLCLKTSYPRTGILTWCSNCVIGTCPWPEFLRIWSEVTGVKSRYQEVTREQFTQENPDKEFGREAGDMFAYSSDPGYDGGDAGLLKGADLRKVLFEVRVR